LQVISKSLCEVDELKNHSPLGHFGQTHLYSVAKEVEWCVGAGCNPPERLHGEILDSRSFMIALGTSDHCCINCRMLSKVQRRCKPAMAGSSIRQPHRRCLSGRLSPRLHRGIPRNWAGCSCLPHLRPFWALPSSLKWPKNSS